MNDELTHLVRRCREGDELAWEALVRRFQGRVFALVLHYVRCREEALDVAQDVFVRVYRGLPAFEQETAFVPWLLRVARTCAIDHTRRRKVRPPAQDVPAEDAHALTHPGRGPDDELESDQRQSLVHRAMEHVSEMHREMLQLKEIQGLALTEVAEILGIPVGTAKSRSNRARLELAGVLRRLDAGDENELRGSEAL